MTSLPNPSLTLSSHPLWEGWSPRLQMGKLSLGGLPETPSFLQGAGTTSALLSFQVQTGVWMGPARERGLSAWHYGASPPSS